MIRFLNASIVLSAIFCLGAGCSRTDGGLSNLWNKLFADMKVDTVPAVPQPSGPDMVAVDTRLTQLMGREAAQAMEFLRSIGFSNVSATYDSWDGVAFKVVEARRVEANLDRDPGNESVIQITVSGVDEENRTITYNTLAWLDPVGDRFVPVGLRDFSTDSCRSEGSLKFRPVRIRDTAFHDIVVDWDYAPDCMGFFSNYSGTNIVGIRNGQLIDMLKYSDMIEYDAVNDRVIDPMILVSLSDTIPPRATWTRQDSGEVMYTSVFNLATERFELLSELTPIDAAIDLGQGPRLKDNCFMHIRSGHLSRALGAGQKTLQSTQMADNEFAGSAYYNMGLISRDTGDSAAAIDWFKKSLMYRPNNKIVMAALAAEQRR